MLNPNLKLNHSTVLVTGAAGFIGASLVRRLFCDYPDIQIIGIDSMTDYYDVGIKRQRIDHIERLGRNWTFIEASIADTEVVGKIFNDYHINIVVNLAAQAGVRYSITHPDAYIQSNIIGFYNILEACRHHAADHLVYASSSSVYGSNTKIPYSTDDKTDSPVSLYAATKKSNELMAHAYSKLYDIPSTGLRFFTVYGPWGRPDMALFKFTKAILAGESIDVYNHGEMHRDFTYIDDIAEAIVRLQAVIPQADPSWTVEQGSPATSSAPYHVYNIGNSAPVKLMEYISALEQALGVTARKNMLPMQPGDVMDTSADTEELYRDIGFKPETSVEEGVKRFVDWYKAFYQVQ